MKGIFTIIICTLLFNNLIAQQSKIENVRLNLSKSNDSLVVSYDLTGKRILNSVKLNVQSEEGQQYSPRKISGDIGIVIPGINKTITWDMKAENADVAGKTLIVKITGKEFVPAGLKKKVWIPWLYIASAASAATGLYAHIRADQLYKDYPPSISTDEAEGIYADVEKMQSIRNVAFGAAVGLGVAGVVVHIKHNQKQKALALSYTNLHQGGMVGLTLNF